MNVRANKHLLLWSSLATLGLLAGAAFEENTLQEWRRLQREYRSRLPRDAARDFELQLRQIVVPSLDVTDRCVSCHVGMAPGESGIEGHPVFARHPNVVHDPAEYGCTVCHGGQGRATESGAAHGTVRHWPEPMIPKSYAYAGCGICHSHLEVPRLSRLEHGRSLVERLDCLRCHALDGRGGTTRPGQPVAVTAPDLSRAGALGFDAGWYDEHIVRRDTSTAGVWRTSFGDIAASDRDAIAELLASRVGAPGLVESKAMFHSQGCRGCHKVNGVGGDDGPDLSRVGQMDPGQRDFSHVAERSVAAWIAEHFRRPSVVVPGSAMPALGLSEDEIEALTFYMLSLRRTALPEAYWPNDRVRSERFGAREFATDGATLYGTFCAACHGPRGEGMRYTGMPAFPAIGNASFLALAPDALLAETIRHGRRGRRMPAWGEGEGGLRPAEIDSLVAYLRHLGGGARPAPDPKPARWVAGDATAGQGLFASNCASCHGPQGEGGEGPALRNPVLQAHATDTYLVETIRRGRHGTSMQGFATGSVTRRALEEREIEAIVAFLRTWEAKP